MANKSSSKTPTTRVMSKIGGNPMAYNQNIPSVKESQSSLNDQAKDNGQSLLIEREEFLETPRYNYLRQKESGMPSFVEINGIKADIGSLLMQSSDMIN